MASLIKKLDQKYNKLVKISNKTNIMYKESTLKIVINLIYYLYYNNLIY